jgi:transposase
LSKKESPINLSQEEIRAVYAQGEEAVVTLVTKLLEHLIKLESRVEDLEGRFSKTSRNSSKPPSGDGFGKRTKSLRIKSDKPSGGQPDHPGSTLEWRNEVDAVEVHPVTECSECGVSLSEVPVEQVFSRQVFDIPPIELRVTEHQVEVKCCPDCGQQSQGTFPAQASNVVQYGPRLKGIMLGFGSKLRSFEKMV